MPGHEIATATGFVFVWRSLGQVFGVGLSSAVYQSSLAHELVKRFEDEGVSFPSSSVSVSYIPCVFLVICCLHAGPALPPVYPFKALFFDHIRNRKGLTGGKGLPRARTDPRSLTNSATPPKQFTTFLLRYNQQLEGRSQWH